MRPPHILLAFMLAVSFACNVVVAEKQERVDTYELAQKLEGLGYIKSARHYYHQLALKADLTDEFRKKVEGRLKAIDTTMIKRGNVVALPDLDEFQHFTVAEKLKPKLVNTKVYPNEFPSTRINRKKWFWRTVAVVVVSFAAYKVHLHLNKEPPPASHNVTVGY